MKRSIQSVFQRRRRLRFEWRERREMMHGGGVHSDLENLLPVNGAKVVEFVGPVQPMVALESTSPARDPSHADITIQEMSDTDSDEEKSAVS